MKRNLVSVVVPVYNAEKYICDCVDSVLSQTYSNFELILVDDGSIDQSPMLCDRLSEKDSRIRVIHQDNKGVAAARNTGIDNCCGKYITFLDADDWWDSNFLEYMVAKQECNDIVICELVKCTSNGRKFIDYSFQCDMTEWCWPIMNNYHIACCRCIYNKEIIDIHHIRFADDRKTGEDQEFAYCYMLHIERIGYESNAKYFYRVNPDSVMFTANYNHFHAVDAMKAVEQYADSVCQDYRAEIVKDKFRKYKYPYILEYAILTVITSGDKPLKVISFLRDKGYYDMLEFACRADQHYESKFISLWRISPNLCLYYYYLRRKVGKMLKLR